MNNYITNNKDSKNNNNSNINRNGNRNYNINLWINVYTQTKIGSIEKVGSLLTITNSQNKDKNKDKMVVSL